MKYLEVGLIPRAMDILNSTASELKLKPEEAFRYVVRNMLKVYHLAEDGGFIRLIDSIGNMTLLPFLEAEDYHIPLFDKLTLMFRRKSEPKPLKSTLFSATVEDELIENVELQANVFGLSQADLYNRLLIVGCALVVHLRSDHQAFAYSKTGEALGKIEFVYLYN